MTEGNPWVVQIFGDPNGNEWEISIVRLDNDLGRHSWGWFGENKLLVSHNGSHCRWPLAPGLGAVMIDIAEKHCALLNKKGSAK